MPVAATEKLWTLEELHRLPDDGNKYELVRGELFVTPAPTDMHETILARLTRILEPYVARHALGYVYHPRAVFRFDGSEVEPDLMVRAGQPRGGTWDTAPRPILIVEVLSPTTRRRDRGPKRGLYVDAAIHDYWIVDPDGRAITVIQPGADDLIARDGFVWHPRGASDGLSIKTADVFGEE
jgi:Uma2 family endonuclease